jgi:plastocyanin
MRRVFLSALMLLVADSLAGQVVNLTGRVELVRAKGLGAGDQSKVVVWLTPLNGTAASTPAPAEHVQLVQREKTFEPHLLVIPVGTAVDFPNRDPFFHNVFSLFAGKRFDLGLYEAGSTRKVHFDRPGISYIFCNIHPEMSAVVVALNTTHYAISDKGGNISIADVPPGRYELHVWSELASPEALQGMTREITVAEGASSLGTIRLVEAELATRGHKNKYGREYDPNPSSPAYNSPR